MTQERRKKGNAARELLGDQRLLAFLRAIRDGDVMAARAINSELDAGAGLDDLFAKREGLHYKLTVEERDNGEYLIEFGCLADAEAGDGGSWIVRWDRNGEITSIEGGWTWIS